ncbi:MAG: alkaline phosphatase family protein [Planctomycetes bacterium]|nr:alkaline phosphatase family protein [Planctomycetota bacterium]
MRTTHVIPSIPDDSSLALSVGKKAPGKICSTWPGKPDGTLLVLGVRFGAAVLAAAALLAGPCQAQAIDRTKSRVVVLGFDGMDATIATSLMQQGKLPFLAELSRRGTFAPLATTNPAQSPVSWAALNTGTNPGKTGITGFVERGQVAAPEDSPYRETPGPKLGLSNVGTVDIGALSPWLGESRRLWLYFMLALGPCGLLFVCTRFTRRLKLSVGWTLCTIVGAITATHTLWPDGRFLAAFGILAGVSLLGWLFASLLPLLAKRLPLCATLGPALGVLLVANAVQLFDRLPHGAVVPSVTSAVRMPPFWRTTGERGVKTIAYQPAMTFPVEIHEHCKVLAGLGVPDARGSVGEWFLFGEREDTHSTATAGFVENVTRIGTDTGRTFECTVRGPRNFMRPDAPRGESGRVPVTLQVHIDRPVSLADDMLAALATLQERLANSATDRLKQQVDSVRRWVEAQRDDPWVLLQRAAWIEELRQRAERELGNAIESPALEAFASRHADAREAFRARITCQGQVKRLGPGEWSGADGTEPMFRIRFVLARLLDFDAVAVDTVCRVKVLSLDPFRMFVGSLNLDATSPLAHLPIAAPASFGRELESMLGEPFETLGWACATHPLKDEMLDDQTFLEDVELKWTMRKKILLALLEHESDARVHFFVFGETDRVQHMMFRHLDERWPGYDEDAAARNVQFLGRTLQAKETIEAMYVAVDELCRTVYERHVAGNPDATLMICSDHGFSSFRRQWNLQNWLYENGYLVIDEAKLERFRRETQTRDLFEGESVYAYVDWSKTRAYSIGLGKLFLNRANREHVVDRSGVRHEGIVTEEERAALIAELTEKLLAERDPLTGDPIFRAVHRAEDLFTGDAWQDRADLYLGFQYGYRVSWESTLGGMGVQYDPTVDEYGFSDVLMDNDSPWSGDHCGVDPGFVAGVFWSDRRFRVSTDDPLPERAPKRVNPPTLPPAEERGPGQSFHALSDASLSVLHVAPTLLDLVGIDVPPWMDRKPLEMH